MTNCNAWEMLRVFWYGQFSATLDWTHQSVSNKAVENLLNLNILKFFVAFWIALKTHLGLFIPDQYYQVAMNDSWRWAKVDFFVDHAHHPWSSLLYSIIVLYDKWEDSEVLHHNFTICPSAGVY